MKPGIIIRIENLLIAAFAAFIYYQLEPRLYLNFQRFYLIILIWLSFDLSIAGYLINRKIGAYFYNIIHNYILAVSLLFASFIFMDSDFVVVGLILITHIGIDRFLGFGLKYPSDFKNTHIQKI
jgi:hypothetical protein